MAGFLNKLKGNPSAPSPTAKDGAKTKKDEPVLEVTPLEKMLVNAGPLRVDGSDRFYGFENFGNTCYCNSIVQALFYSDLFRDNVMNYPSLSPSDTPNGTKPKVNVTIRPPMNPTPPNPPQGKQKGLSTSQTLKQRQAINMGQPLPGQVGVKPEDKPDTPEYKKKQAMIKGPIVELAQENPLAYGMDECTFTGIKDIFLALMESETRTGVLSPQRFLEIFKRDNEMFRNSMHQDAHEFYGLVLNDVIANVEANARRIRAAAEDADQHEGLIKSVENVLGSALVDVATGFKSPSTGWVHDIFEGVLTSETRCLACETASQRDETFLDLSIDLEEHSSVTSCLRKFSAEEMLCERNKFHCDLCGGLQEAEKRMKVKRLPKVLTLHLKRFKYTEDYSRLQKLFHRVVYPYHLRMFNTTEEAADPDRLYELYAVVVHIGGNAYHGHYVSIIKTKDRGWLLFDDEMVEPVDKHFVLNFFGDKPGMATAYVLFYQETTFEKVRQEQEEEGVEEVILANQAANMAHEDGVKNDPTHLKRQTTVQPTPTPTQPEPESDPSLRLNHANTAPDIHAPEAAKAQASVPAAPTTVSLPRASTAMPEPKTKEDKKREKKEREAAEKAEKQAEKERKEQAKEQAKQEEKIKREEHIKRMQARRNEQEQLQRVMDASKKTAVEEDGARNKEGGSIPPAIGGLDRSRSKRVSRSFSKRLFSSKDKSEPPPVPASPVVENGHNGALPEKQDKLKDRLSMGLGRKKSNPMLS